MRYLTSVSSVVAVLAVSTVAHADTFGSGVNQFSIEFVTIGNAGNSGDFSSRVGSVPYIYRIGKYEITRDVIDRANAEGNLGITLADMTSLGGNGPSKPATGMGWNEAAWFINWLNTSQGYSPAYKFGKHGGGGDLDAYNNIRPVPWEAEDAGFDAANPMRNRLAHYFLPNLYEWYKASYYDPHANNGAGGYWRYSTSSNSTPVPVSSGSTFGTLVYRQEYEQGPTDTDKAGGPSPFGVVGLCGNVWDLAEVNVGKELTILGGNWRSYSQYLSSSFNRRGYTYTGIHNLWNAESPQLGFRVASIPEPSSLLLGLLGGLGMLGRRRREI